MKKPIAWHKQCLKNAQAHWEREVARIEAAERRLAKEREICGEQLKGQIMYEAQILDAEREGLEEFDRHTYQKQGKGGR